MGHNPTIDLGGLPAWVPRGAKHYIAHTEHGQPIRALARAAGCHASTILRQIRKVELRRDDPLVDAALRKLGEIQRDQSGKMNAVDRSKPGARGMSTVPQDIMPDETTMARDSMRILRRLCESGAVLAFAAGLDRAVVVRDLPGGSNTRTAIVDAPVAQAMALKDWIAPENTGRIIRYRITAAGRAALAEFLHRFGKDSGAEAGGAGEGTEGAGREDFDRSGRSGCALGESPLNGLARRKNKDGSAFLDNSLIHAAERLREDFELAQMDPSTTQNWDYFLTPGTKSSASIRESSSRAPAQARQRVQAALEDMGPGLAEVALRCCCYLEGLETTEKRLGWSARSGKIVLRIALMRLRHHYDETCGPGGGMIG